MPYRPTKETEKLLLEHPQVAVSIAKDLLRQAKAYVNPVTARSFNNAGGVLTTIRSLIGFMRGLLLFGNLPLDHDSKKELVIGISELRTQLEKFKPKDTRSIEYARWRRAVQELERLARELGVVVHG